MKKKWMTLLLVILVLAFGMQADAYASETSLAYSGIYSIISTMGIDGYILEYSVDVITQGNSYADAVHIDAELRTVDGRLIKTYSEDLEESNTVFTFSKRRAVSESGTYFLLFTVYCYNDGELVDKVTKTSKTATYTR